MEEWGRREKGVPHLELHFLFPRDLTSVLPFVSTRREKKKKITTLSLYRTYCLFLVFYMILMSFFVLYYFVTFCGTNIGNPTNKKDKNITPTCANGKYLMFAALKEVHSVLCDQQHFTFLFLLFWTSEKSQIDLLFFLLPQQDLYKFCKIYVRMRFFFLTSRGKHILLSAWDTSPAIVGGRYWFFTVNK